MTLGIIATIALIFINWFFVAAEFAIVKVRATLVDIKVKEGSKYAKDVQHIQTNLDKYLSAMQLWITLTSLWLWWVWEEAMTHIVMKTVQLLGLPFSEATASTIAIPLAFVLITMLHIIIGEQLPKYIAISNPLATSMKTGWLLRWFYRIFSPFIWLLHTISAAFARMLWIDPHMEEEAHNEEEIRMMLVESEEGGYINANSHELIQNVFSFDDRQVRHIYTPKKDIAAIDIARDPQEIVKYIIQENYSRYPVYDKNFDNMLGILNAKDVMQHVILGNVNQDVIRRIVRPYHAVPLIQSIESLLHDMQMMHNHIALVQNEYWEIIGIVSMEDIIEELIGDVQDETDTEQQPYTILDDGTWMMQWQVAISDIIDILPAELPEDDAYTTLWWYLIQLRWRIPVKWEILEDEYYTYRVESMGKHTIHTIHMSLK